MKKLIYSLTICLPLLFSGCSINQTMPKTTIRFDPVTRSVDIQSPKDIEIQNFSLLYQTNGQVSLAFSNYTSHQNASVVNAVAAYNKAMQDAALKAGEKALGAAAGFAK